ncbi:MAG: 30S ribosomal protein S1 [Candidatus Babeliales bacterium]
MAKEVLRASQFARALPQVDDEHLVNAQLQQELETLFDGAFENLTVGTIIQASIIKVENDGALVDIGYKSHGFIPRYEFSDYEMKNLKVGDVVEVILDELEGYDGNIHISYEKAKSLRAWDKITKLFESGEPAEGIVTHKVKGGLSVDIGVSAFLPGSQVDLHRITNFDEWVGQRITANVLKINQKRGNVIISRRKHLQEQRTEQRKDILTGLEVGQVIPGIVKNITNYGAFIDIGGVDGLLHITDMTWGRIGHPSELIKLGEKIDVKVLSFDKDHEKISLGLKQLSENPWDKVTGEVNAGDTIKGVVSSITDYGLFVEVAKGVEGLVHISEVSWGGRIDNLKKQYKPGQEVAAKVVSIDKENRRMSLSIKQLEKNPWEGIAEEFKVGQKVKGPISNITDFGVFVELKPGIDGLVYISDLSWTEHIVHPSDRYKVGTEIEAVVLSVDEKSQRVSLGVKQLGNNPWETIEKDFPVGSIIEGEVSKITNFGAFVKLASGVEGLVHVKEYPGQKIEDILKVGQKEKFRVVKVSSGEQKIGLSPRLDATAEQPREQREPREAKAPRERTERGERSERGSERSERGERPERKERKSQTQPEANRPKSLLQLELERHKEEQKEADKETSAPKAKKTKE